MSRRLILVLPLLVACGDNYVVPPDPPDAACAQADPPAADCADPCFNRHGPELRLELTLDELALPAPPAGSTPVRVSLFYTVAPQAPQGWTRAEVVGQMRQIVTSTDAILVQCNMHVELEVAQVVALPARLLDIEGNEEGSFGGHPPEGTPSPDRFDYDQNERLTAESRELFRYGKAYSSKNTIDAYTIDHIVYYANQMLDEAGGLSYPANIYHHADDYPYRNAVLLVPAYGACGDLPGVPDARTLAHEIGHMLLNSGGHVGTFNNLMVGGSRLTPEQCTTMAANLAALFGDAEVPDPGPPGG